MHPWDRGFSSISIQLAYRTILIDNSSAMTIPNSLST
jgi:hypothetical protein